MISYKLRSYENQPLKTKPMWWTGACTSIFAHPRFQATNCAWTGAGFARAVIRSLVAYQLFWSVRCHVKWLS